MKSSHLIALLLAVAVTLWILSGQWNDNASSSMPPPPLAPGAKIDSDSGSVGEAPSVRVLRSVARNHRGTVTLYGHTAPSRVLDLKAETEGRVASIHVEHGQSVVAGTVLLQLAMDDRRERLRQAQADLAEAELSLNAARKLSAKGFKGEIALAEKKALLAAAKANLRAIHLDIERTRVAAPFAARVERRLVEQGDLVENGTLVARLVDLDPLLVVGSVTERQVGLVTPAQIAEAELATGRTVEGIVTYVAPVAQERTRTFAIELEVPNPAARIPAGITARIALPQLPVRAHHLSPAALSLADDGTLGVKSVEDAVVFHPVEVVATDQDGIWVTGLPETSLVIVVGHEFVSPGQVVTAVPIAAMPGAVEPGVGKDPSGSAPEGASGLGPAVSAASAEREPEALVESLADISPHPQPAGDSATGPPADSVADPAADPGVDPAADGFSDYFGSPGYLEVGDEQRP